MIIQMCLKEGVGFKSAVTRGTHEGGLLMEFQVYPQFINKVVCLWTDVALKLPLISVQLDMIPQTLCWSQGPWTNFALVECLVFVPSNMSKHVLFTCTAMLTKAALDFLNPSVFFQMFLETFSPGVSFSALGKGTQNALLVSIHLVGREVLFFQLNLTFNSILTLVTNFGVEFLAKRWAVFRVKINTCISTVNTSFFISYSAMFSSSIKNERPSVQPGIKDRKCTLA